MDPLIVIDGTYLDDLLEILQRDEPGIISCNENEGEKEGTS